MVPRVPLPSTLPPLVVVCSFVCVWSAEYPECLSTYLLDVAQQWDCTHGGCLLIWFGLISYQMLLLSTSYKILKSQNLSLFYKRRHLM